VPLKFRHLHDPGVLDPTTNRFRFWGDHEVAVAPFVVPNATPDDELDGLRQLPNTFPTVTGYLPRLEELAEQHRGDDGQLHYPDGVTGRTLLQQATRETLTDMGFDVDGLTDAQMTDNHGWLLFPNFFEPWFVLIAGRHEFHLEQRLSGRRFVWVCVALGALKLMQEFVVHYLKLLDGFTAVEAVEAIWDFVTP